MTSRTRTGFTLVELLVVVSIIALLVTMLLPTLARGVELARRARCAVNCRQIAHATKLYCTTGRYHRGAAVGRGLPVTDPVPGSDWHTGATANRQCAWILVTKELLSPGSLLCPSVDENRTDTFVGGDPCGYGLLSMVGRTVSLNDAYASLVIVGDRNPQFSPNSKTVYNYADLDHDGSTASPGEAARVAELNSGGLLKNSASHDYEGQNVGRLDESAGWLTEPVVRSGSAADDNIYEAGSGGSTGGGTVAGPDDVLLLN